ncbi:unnamed protein product [Calicophoron daubneyi]
MSESCCAPFPEEQCEFFDFVIVGGGIAGVVCAETLCELISPSRYAGAVRATQSGKAELTVAIVSATNTVKTTVNLHRITNMIESFDVTETAGSTWSETWPGILTVLYDTVEKIDPPNHLVYLHGRGSSRPLRYGRLCLTTGGAPRLIDPKHPRVVALRDTESLEAFQSKLRGTRRLMLVGNGGIATEIAHEVRGCQLIWAIKDASISAPFVDPAAAKFLLAAREMSRAQNSTEMRPTQLGDEPGPVQIRRMRYVISDGKEQGGHTLPGDAEGRLLLVPDKDHESRGNRLSGGTIGAALGPDWAHGRVLRGQLSNEASDLPLKVVYKVMVKRLVEPSEFRTSGLVEINPFTDQPPIADDWPVYVELTNGEVYGCDLIVSAVGVEASFEPNRVSEASTRSHFFGVPFEFAAPRQGGGLLVDEQMQTSVKDVYAAGDCAYANWTWAPHWFQMRLWNQARQMAFQAAKAMYGHTKGEGDVPLDFSFDLFTHVTYFFGFKVVLIGLYNGQGLDLTSPDCYLLMRVTPGKEYIKCVMRSGRMQGALLIGETDLEEVLENLIVNQLDLTDLEDSLLDPNIDLTDYFD